MSSQSGFTGIWCKRCDQSNPSQPSRLVRQMAGKQEGMLLKCPQCGYQSSYANVMASHPRMDKVDFVEKPSAGTKPYTIHLHPEVIEAWQRKFPSNPMTTLTAAVTALADPDSVLIEGDYAREMASLGIRRGREVLSMAKELKELRDEVAGLKLRESTLRAFFSGLGLAMPQVASQPAVPTDLPAPPVDANGNVLTPPRAQFSQLRDDGSGLLVPADGAEPIAPSQFSFPTGAAPAADVRPAFITSNLR
jgi:hypothetical protein